MNDFIIRKTFTKLMLIQFFSIVVSAANAAVDNVIIDLFLDPNIIAATGLFAPVITVMGLSYVIITGLQILCSRAVGSGEGRRAVSLFCTGAVFLAVFGIAVSVLCLMFSDSLALLLQGGSESPAGVPLREYMHGYSYGIVLQVLSSMLMVFLPLNNSTKLSYISTIVMLVSNIAMDLLSAALDLGPFGIGIATSISYLLSFLSMLPPFMDKNKAVHFAAGNFCYSWFDEALTLGLPSLMFTIGCTVKGYMMNYTLMQNLGSDAVAVMNVQGSICSVLGVIPMGCANAFMSLGSLYYGDTEKKTEILCWLS